MAVLEDAGRPASCTAGHSVGEIAALYAAGVFDFDTAVRVVRRRGELMSTAQPGVMAAVIGLDEPTITAVCDTARAWGRVCIGLQNGASNFVISGDDAAIEVAAARCRDRGALKVTRLRTGFAFHSPIMDPVVRPWRDYVATIPLRRPTIPVALNSTGAIATDTDVVRHALVDQIARPVRWHNCLRSLVDVGARSFVEVGDSKVLSAQVRELDRTLAVGTMADPRVERRLFSTRTWESHGAVS
jgi:malonyl CoA-acyl carrier protein transacylase